MKFSGKNTNGNKLVDPECIRHQIVFEVQWSNCPVEIEEEVKKLWREHDYGNDNYFHEWDSAEDGYDYPEIDEFLLSKGITRCWIHWWW